MKRLLRKQFQWLLEGKCFRYPVRDKINVLNSMGVGLNFDWKGRSYGMRTRWSERRGKVRRNGFKRGKEVGGLQPHRVSSQEPGKKKKNVNERTIRIPNL